jgi:hypothetical protein
MLTLLELFISLTVAVIEQKEKSGSSKGKGGKSTANNSKATDDAEAAVDQDDFTKMDIRVGQITKVRDCTVTS